MFGGPFLLVIFAMIAALSVRVWLKRVLPMVARLDPDSPRASLWSDGALPILLVIPFFGLVIRAGRADLANGGWLIVTGPIVIGAVGGGVTLVLAESFRASRQWLFAELAWIATGVVILLLSAIGSLSLIVGQTLLATGAVLLWVVTPIESRATSTQSRDSSAHIGRGAVMLFALAVIAATLIAIAPASWHEPALSMHIASALVILVSTLRAGATQCALRAAGWTAAHGALLGLGLLSLVTLIARRAALVGSVADPSQQAEYLFNRVTSSVYLLALPAVMLILLAIATAACAAIPRAIRRIVGAGLTLLALAVFAILLQRTTSFP